MRSILHPYFSVAIRGRQLHSFYQRHVLHRQFHAAAFAAVKANLALGMAEHHASNMRIAFHSSDARPCAPGVT
jgi:hypothetical protein